MNSIARKITREIIASDIVYAGWSKNTFGEYVVDFRIDNVRYHYYLTYKDKGVIEWMLKKKKLDDGVLLNYAKKNAYEVWKGNEKIQSEKIKTAKDIQKSYSDLMTLLKDYSTTLEGLIAKLFELVPDVDNGLIGNIMGLDICAVKGSEVKLDSYMDFVEGGHDKVYKFIPENTVWIDNGIDKAQWKYIILHEMIERWLMDKMTYTYNDAHDIANMFEKEFRKKERL